MPLKCDRTLRQVCCPSECDAVVTGKDSRHADVSVALTTFMFRVHDFIRIANTLG